MRIAIISDIHGNQVAFEAVLDDLSQQTPVDEIVIAGDNCLNGPRPREVLTMLQELRCPVLQGNVDEDIVTLRPKKGTKKRAMVEWTREQIGPEGIEYLASLPTSHLVTNPEQAEGSNVLVVHANPLNLDEALFPSASDETLEHYLGELDSSIGVVAFGHFHVAYMRHWRHLLLLDAGSCGLPRDEDLRASYATLTWHDGEWEAEHRRVPYDVDLVVEQMKESGMPNVEKRIKILTGASYAQK
jgi:putative phosphoesterase